MSAALSSELRRMMAALVRQMADHGYERNYRRAIVEGLDPSPEARFMRGYEQGWRLPQYHGTNVARRNYQRTGRDEPDVLAFTDAKMPSTPFRAFNRDGTHEMGIHTASEPQTAANRVKYRDQKYIMPLLLRSNNPLRLPDLGNFKSPSMLLAAITNEGSRNYTKPFTQKAGLNIPPDLFDALIEAAASARQSTYEQLKAGAPRTSDFNGWPDRFRDIIRRHGYDAIAYRNTVEGDEISHMALEPQQIRSVNAMFNPRRRDRKDILAALALMLAGSGGIGAGLGDKRRRRG